MWDHAEAVMTRVLDEIRTRHGNIVTTALNPGEGAFYGPKFEYVLRDAIGRDWQTPGTTQVDFNLPERFGAFYIAGNSEKTTPVMIHRAICGSWSGPWASCSNITRATCRCGSHRYRSWSAPSPVTPTPRRFSSWLGRRSGACESRPTYETRRSNKVREHSLAKIPVLIALGRKEASENTISLRRLGSNAQATMDAEEALEALASEALPPDLRG